MSSSSKDTILMSIDEYIEFLGIPYEKIKSATNNFADENLLTQGTAFKVYKGQLLQSGDLINIVARKSLQTSVALHEVIISRNINHKHIIPTYKLSRIEDEVFIINKREANGSLEKHLSDTTLTWIQRLHICVGVAHALKYLHYDAADNHYVIHGNIKSSKILLDDNCEPKLHGFGYAVKAKKHYLHLTRKYNGSLQYMDPSYENSSGLTHKSDIFSFGVLMFEVLFGREASIQNNDNWYFARLAKSHYEDNRLDDLINPDIRKQMNLQSFNIFIETAYYCLKEQRSQRPDINQVLSKLEKALELEHKHAYLITADAILKDTSLPNYLKGKNLNHLIIGWRDIELATNNFSEAHCIGSGGYGKVYKAKLAHFDVMNSMVDEGKNKGIFPRKQSTVAIKRISSRVDGQGEQGFFVEIEMLSKCKHPNVVSLLGFCVEGSEMILVYEYMSNGSLDDYIGNTNNMTNLNWAQRIQLCLDIAHGLNYLHTSTEEKKCIIHRDIKSGNILLDDKWVAKIADFGLSKLHHAYEERNTLVTNNIAGTEVYLDPEYKSTGKLTTKSDVYSFGVVMFEIMCGKLAYDKTYNEKGLPSIARHCFNEGTMMNLVDPKIMEADENISMIIGGVNRNSLATFSKVAYRCLAETQSERPTIEVVIKKLSKALNFEKKSKDKLHIQLQDIKLGTQNFSDCKCIGEGKFWKLYEGQVVHANGFTDIFAKRWDNMSPHVYYHFLTELEVLVKYNHKNIIELVGYCNKENEKIIVYKHASNRSLNKHLGDPSLTWTKRLKICIGVANGLEFIHKTGVEHDDSIIHRDITSGSILLDGEWDAKLSNFELSCKPLVYDRAEHVDYNYSNSLGYADPEYKYNGYLTEKSDIYSLGVILIEMLCGRLAWVEGCEDHSQSLGPSAVRHYALCKNLDEMIFEGIKGQITPQSLTTFVDITLKCLKDDARYRPRASDVVIQLKKAMEFQEDYEIWEPKLPIDYKEILEMSKYSENIEMKKDLFDMFCKGILVQDDKALFSLGNNGERNEMISAIMFSYKNRASHKCRSVQGSRFPKVVRMLDSSNLEIQIKMRTQFLTPCFNYKVYLIFRFCGARTSQSKRMYVNLKYKIGSEILHAYFATWREDEWMMIELFQFSTKKKDTYFEVLLESFSRCYCGRRSIYIEGIQFQAIDNAKHEEFDVLKESQVFKSKSKTDKVSPSKMKVKKDHMTWFLLSQIKRKKDEKENMISAKYVVYNSSRVAIRSRFSGAIELLRKQVFHIRFMIESQRLTASKVCYLVFKLSDKFCELNGPVIVRDIFHWRSRETGTIYFRLPKKWNLHDTDWAPKKRKDGWMEVIVWKHNSNYEFRDDYFWVNLKLVTFEGTMAGLILRNIEFRPI